MFVRSTGSRSGSFLYCIRFESQYGAQMKLRLGCSCVIYKLWISASPVPQEGVRYYKTCRAVLCADDITPHVTPVHGSLFVNMPAVLFVFATLRLALKALLLKMLLYDWSPFVFLHSWL